MLNIQKQEGFGFFSVIYNTSILAMIAYIVILLAPVYLEDRAVKEAMNNIGPMSIVKPSDSLRVAETNIRNYLAENFRMNNVVHVPLEHIEVNRNTNGFQVSIAYHIQKPVLGNVDFLVNFNNQVTVIV